MRIYTFILAALLGAGGLRANDVFIGLDVSTVTLSPGDTFIFSGAITNNDQSTVDLNNIDITLDGSLFQVDPSFFFSGPPTVAAGASTPSVLLFSVTVDLPYTAPPGVQTGLTILGGRSDSTGFPGLGSVLRERVNARTVHVRDDGAGNPRGNRTPLAPTQETPTAWRR
jgi:hypothetical protein